MGNDFRNSRRDESNEQVYEGPERRAQLAPDIRAYINERIEVAVANAVDAALTRHIAELKGLVLSGYPGDDPDGHRRYHETQIKMMEDRAKMYREIRDKTITGLVWLGILAIGTALLDYAKRHLTGN